MAKPVEKVMGRDLREELVEQHQRLVYFVANQFRQSKMEWDDLVQIGFIGLIKAVDRYNPGIKKVKFSTFAFHYIRGEILHELRALKRHNPAMEVSVENVVEGGGEDDEIRLMDTLGTDPDEVETTVSNRVALEEGMVDLTCLEQEIIRLQYCKQWTRKEIAELFDVPEKRIRVIEQKAIRKLRRRMVR
ncbi:sigma-70 family RNA polymerase sigma factor [Kroppenstedtia eburnea]|uniref:RNA polymerase sporulation-specific sigma factor n=1 Tax=Kroppenstedtia eburnea TaxID=714067 RepID=A0A1N7JG48_9BACL|nr:sigma-70 family RNA polymerase sigma factor [Kroppenstedtia eburnea]QKI80571.1 sigma-70 family RNA polymerase sigma factor [Kroppenstedtia eburnea]SIS48289.1 RNA polymerase sporulation-specific sigma factor [Kroppenstedtia eburnea]